MKLAQDKTKRLVILLWCFTVSGFLYYFAAAMAIHPAVSIDGFLNFTILLFGGGFAYHVTNLLLQCPQTQTNQAEWFTILCYLLKLAIGYVFAGISLYLGTTFGGNYGWLLAFAGLLMGCFWVMHFLLDLNKPIQKLLNKKEDDNDLK